MDEQIRHKAGEERARTDGNEVGGRDGLQGLREGRRSGRGKVELRDSIIARGDVCFASDDAAIDHLGYDLDIRVCGGDDIATRFENLAGDFNRVREIAGDVGKSCQEEIAKTMPDEAFAGSEAVLKQPSHQRLGFRERDHAVANVARRQNVEVATKTATGATVVGDGYHSREGGD
jgi:hypothetical protein